MSNSSPMSFFKEIVKIPRDTGDEKQISNYLVSFAAQRGLDASQDSAYNVVIRKPAAPGYESAPVLALQSHIDIVYIKSSDSTHDYNSPLKLIEKDGFLSANGTSLGADNGIGMAYMLALLDSSGLPHPPLECLFTTGEEAGMLGAMKLTPDTLCSRRMINLDSEEEGVFTAGCAGGQRVVLSLPAQWCNPVASAKCYLLQVHGLLGGHSGIDIGKGRGNANRLLGRALKEISNHMPLQVGEVQGGSKMNAIPDRSEAYLYIPESDASNLALVVERCNKTFSNELSGSDPDVVLSLTPTKGSNKVMSPTALERFLLLLLTLPVGVQTMSAHLPGLPETSNNIGLLRTEDERVELCCAIRSSVGSLKQAVFTQMEVLGAAAGAAVTSDSSYPEWSYRPVSPLRDACAKTYQDMYGKKPEIEVIHAGLECGYFCALFPGMDVVSLGPNLRDVHTPQETADIASVERVWEFLVRLVSELK